MPTCSTGRLYSLKLRRGCYEGVKLYISTPPHLPTSIHTVFSSIASGIYSYLYIKWGNECKTYEKVWGYSKVLYRYGLYKMFTFTQTFTNARSIQTQNIIWLNTKSVSIMELRNLAWRMVFAEAGVRTALMYTSRIEYA